MHCLHLLTAAKCNNLDVIINGTHNATSGDNNYTESTLRVTCDDFYQINEDGVQYLDVVIICDENGMWLNPPNCTG